MHNELILPGIFIIALLYSSVGHGGASGYLAIMALSGISPAIMRPQALILNLFVAGSAFIFFYKRGHFNRKLLTWFALTSVPAAYISSQWHINSTVYKIILGICLVIATIRILYRPSETDEPIREMPKIPALIIGLGLGLISGMIGIGGGIILSPLLIIFRRATIKQSAGISAMFILLNSVSGLAGLIHQGYVPDGRSLVWILAALLGGLTGSYLGSSKLTVNGLKYVLSAVLCFAAIKLMSC
jgi:uncharacterized membrane protein YfcA